ncbi:Asp-tRNA(Asn)/Glu-tRNA(Gln) amidotransferase subunit GatC [Vaginisenegalia massiliensis]|uniref:Asp-tRNA(Asn)/Glu-tRNA(Gln) amidotransferase subunit GatC n=1 Tax=Vaginisenegalia massiliensis TaxID=2058294 RepID=UPI000F524A07|nr:Asp-tRNA(Asn)/Glu-tRNA(Gln) amidotransferase subunit GatC [Vaginisenegalia massiliensis]
MINQNDIKHVAKLAKLQFQDSELEKFTSEFNQIISLVEHLTEVDTQGIEPTYHGNDLMNVYRQDQAQLTADRQAMLANAQTMQDGFIKVPAILESEEA